jgi:S1-C subfamily serine protease
MAQPQEPWAGHHAGLPAPPPPPRTPWRGGWVALAISILAAAIVAGAALSQVGTGSVASGTRTGTGTGGGGSRTTGSVAVGSVVDIDTSAETLAADGLRPLGAGTGMILTADGEILTNNHVIAGASQIQVSIQGHGTQTATVVGVDPTDDVALLQLNDVSGLPTVAIGDSSAVQVGDEVTAIGNAFGAPGPPTSTTGKVTAVNRSIIARDPAGGTPEQLKDVIQIDAGVQPGDSGGALVNADGQVIGIITAGPSNSQTGVGFAIPIDAALQIVDQIRAGNASSDILLGERGFIGVAVQPLDAGTASQLGLGDTNGALVTGVKDGSPAAAAGMTAPSVIRAIDGRTVTNLDDLGNAIHSKTPGEQIQVTWVDALGQHTATLTLSSGPAV